MSTNTQAQFDSQSVIEAYLHNNELWEGLQPSDGVLGHRQTLPLKCGVTHNMVPEKMCIYLFWDRDHTRIADTWYLGCSQTANYFDLLLLPSPQLHLPNRDRTVFLQWLLTDDWCKPTRLAIRAFRVKTYYPRMCKDTREQELRYGGLSPSLAQLLASVWPLSIPFRSVTTRVSAQRVPTLQRRLVDEENGDGAAKAEAAR